jgi:hypothetical protein
MSPEPELAQAIKKQGNKQLNRILRITMTFFEIEKRLTPF